MRSCNPPPLASNYSGFLLSLVAIAVTLGSAQVSWAQARVKIGGLETILPGVPVSPSRPAQGADPLEQWAPPQNQAATASLISSLKKNDAALEVIVGQSRLITLKKDLADLEGTSVIAVSDPSIVDFEIMPNPRFIRLLGLRPGVTDITIMLADGETYGLEVHVAYDLQLLRFQLQQVFPDALIQLGQIREHLVVEGQARNAAQVAQIIGTIQAYLISVQNTQSIQASQAPPPEDGPPVAQNRNNAPPNGAEPPLEDEQPGEAEAGQEEPPVNDEEVAREVGTRPNVRARIAQAQIINLLKVPGSQQVMLKVKIAELNRTAMREIGSDIQVVDSATGNLFGTSLSNGSVSALGTLGLGGLTGGASGALANGTTFGIFPSGDFQIILQALRTNSVVRILAEPNLIAMDGNRASFLAGGEFPVPIQTGTGAGVATSVQFKEFGVKLDFLPHIVEQDRIRLSVQPEVSNVDFALGTTLVPGGSPVPGINTRRVGTTVQLDQGQTLAIAGLISVEMGGDTTRIPGLGDLPYIGPLFSNTSHRRIEKELLVLVTPYIVESMSPDQCGPLPGEELRDPNDLEVYFMNRIEGRTATPHRSTTQYEWCDPKDCWNYDTGVMHGPVGFSEPPLVPAP